MKIAFVYDRVNKWGGAEKVLLALHEIWPDAPLFTSVYNNVTAKWAEVFDVRTSFIQKLPIPKNAHDKYPFIMGMAFESFNFDEYDVVISVTSEFAKAIITKPKTLHLCYCLNPTGYLWSGYDQYFSGKSKLLHLLAAPLIKYLRWYDKIVCHRPDKYVAISNAVSSRIAKYYGLSSGVIYPPVESREPAKPTSTNDKEYYLVVARLVPNKRIDLAIEAFNLLGKKLKIVGVGNQENCLKEMSKSNIEFLGNLTDGELSHYYKGCIALIVPAEEDFGIVAVEAQSFGKPVIAYGKGGALETVVEGKTGWYFRQPNGRSLMEVVSSVDARLIDPTDCIDNAKRFSEEVFKKDFKKMIEKEYSNYIN